MILCHVGHPNGAEVPVSQSDGCEFESLGCLGGTGKFPQCTITELSKAMVGLCDALSMGHCTQKTPCMHPSKRGW